VGLEGEEPTLTGRQQVQVFQLQVHTYAYNMSVWGYQHPIHVFMESPLFLNQNNMCLQTA